MSAWRYAWRGGESSWGNQRRYGSYAGPVGGRLLPVLNGAARERWGRKPSETFTSNTSCCSTF